MLARFGREDQEYDGSDSEKQPERAAELALQMQKALASIGKSDSRGQKLPALECGYTRGQVGGFPFANLVKQDFQSSLCLGDGNARLAASHQCDPLPVAILQAIRGKRIEQGRQRHGQLNVRGVRQIGAVKNPAG